MLRRVVIGVAMACLIGGGAYAQDEEPRATTSARSSSPRPRRPCRQDRGNALSDADAEKVNEMLDEADALCTEGKFPEASATLATINKMVARQ